MVIVISDNFESICNRFHDLQNGKEHESRVLARFLVSESFSSVVLDRPEWKRTQNGGEIVVGDFLYHFHWISRPQKWFITWRADQFQYFQFLTLFHQLSLMDQMEEKEKSEDFETIFNRFLDLKNGFVHATPVTCKIFGFRLFFIRCSGWTRWKRNQNWGETVVGEFWNHFQWISRPQKGLSTWRAGQFQYFQFQTLFHPLFSMDQMEEKEKSGDFGTISNWFLDLKNGLVHEKMVNCKILGFRLFFIRWSGWTRMEEEPEWRRNQNEGERKVWQFWNHFQSISRPQKQSYSDF